MKQCLRITFCPGVGDVLKDFVQDVANSLGLEGTAQKLSDRDARIMVCGSREAVEDFLDTLHNGAGGKKIEELQVEPFLKDKDYRGVFRVIE